MTFIDKQKILKIFGPIFLFIILSLIALFSIFFPDKNKDLENKELLEESNSDFNNLQKSIDLNQIYNELRELTQKQKQEIQSKEDEINFLNNLMLGNENDENKNNFKSKLLDKEKQDLKNKINQLENLLTTSEQLNSLLKEKIIFLENILNDEFDLKNIQKEQIEWLKEKNQKISNASDIFEPKDEE